MHSLLQNAAQECGAAASKNVEHAPLPAASALPSRSKQRQHNSMPLSALLSKGVPATQIEDHSTDIESLSASDDVAAERMPDRHSADCSGSRDGDRDRASISATCAAAMGRHWECSSLAAQQCTGTVDKSAKVKDERIADRSPSSGRVLLQTRCARSRTGNGNSRSKEEGGVMLEQEAPGRSQPHVPAVDMLAACRRRVAAALEGPRDSLPEAQGDPLSHEAAASGQQGIRQATDLAGTVSHGHTRGSPMGLRLGSSSRAKAEKARMKEHSGSSHVLQPCVPGSGSGLRPCAASGLSGQARPLGLGLVVLPERRKRPPPLLSLMTGPNAWCPRGLGASPLLPRRSGEHLRVQSWLPVDDYMQ
jgi:hypothetical protein